MVLLNVFRKKNPTHLQHYYLKYCSHMGPNNYFVSSMGCYKNPDGIKFYILAIHFVLYILPQYALVIPNKSKKLVTDIP